MLVPRSFMYSSPSSPPYLSSSPPPSPAPVKTNVPRPAAHKRSSTTSWLSRSPATTPLPRTTPSDTEPAGLTAMTTAMRSPHATQEPSKPVEIPSPRSSREFKSTHNTKQQQQQQRQNGSRRSSSSTLKSAKHQPDALPPAVAALLAVTAIPPPRKDQFRRKKSESRRISIDELVQGWRNDSSLPAKTPRSSFGGSTITSLDLLLESADEDDDDAEASEGHLFASRSSSCESVPSLDTDDRSVLSVGSPATPESLRSRKSSHMWAKRERSFSSLPTEDCGPNHPLVAQEIRLDDDEPDFVTKPAPVSPDARRRRSSLFRSNLSSSLQALKSRALSSLSSFNAALNQDSSSFSDATLWQHPYIFPHFRHETRPILSSSTPTQSERRYLNPSSLPLREQDHHWRLALSPLDDESTNAPMIQMQTYRRSSSSQRTRSRRATDSSPETPSSQAAALPQLVRPREPRENSNFLRVVVLEMNMRRHGKFEENCAGRARIWLPPRKSSLPSLRDDGLGDDAEEENLEEEPLTRRVPTRWVGVTVEY